MKYLIPIVMVLLCAGCENHQQIKQISSEIDSITTKPDTLKIEKKQIQYTDKQLELFLDSIGQLSSSCFDKVGFYADSIFKNPQQLDQLIDNNDFELLKKSCKTERIDAKTAKRIFKNINDSNYVDSVKSYRKEDSISITFFSFDTHQYDFNEFAIFPGSVSNEQFELYFFKSNRIISKNNFYNKYNGIILKHYKDTDGKTIIYYENALGTGTGVGWYNLYFYKFNGDKLFPILNELERSWVAMGMGYRVLNFESYIQKTNPLTIKMKYSQKLADLHFNEQEIINNSTIVQYHWNEHSKTLKGDYANSKISKYKISSYFFDESIEEELLFINSHYQILKQSINKQNKFQRPAILLYLNKVKNLIKEK